jgi:hypothetical protein
VTVVVVVLGLFHRLVYDRGLGSARCTTTCLGAVLLAHASAELTKHGVLALDDCRLDGFE